jgi:hypothetical protein
MPDCLPDYSANQSNPQALFSSAKQACAKQDSSQMNPNRKHGLVILQEKPALCIVSAQAPFLCTPR